MFGASPTSHDDVASEQPQTRHENNPQGKRSAPLEAEKLKIMIRALGELHGKIAAELIFAKREMAYGKLDGTELKELFKLTRDVFLPITGMSSIADIFDRVAEKRRWKATDSGPQNDLEEKRGMEERKDKEKKQWNEIMKSFHGPFEVMTQAMDEGLQHTLYTLELAKRPKEVIPHKISVADQTSPDVEAQGEIIRPGDKEFAYYLKTRVDNFYEQRKLTLAIWCRQKGVELDENLFNNSALPAPHIEVESENLSQHQQNQQQLYLILYVSILFDLSNSYSALYRLQFVDINEKRQKLSLDNIFASSNFIFQLISYIDGISPLVDWPSGARTSPFCRPKSRRGRDEEETIHFSTLETDQEMDLQHSKGGRHEY